MDDAQIIQTVKSDLSWIQKHERIIALFLILAAGLWIGNKVINRSADKDKIAAALASQQLDQQKSFNAQIKQQTEQTASQYQTMLQQLSAQNSALASAVASRTTGLEKQQQHNQTLPLPELGERWKTLLALKPSDLTATDSGINVSDSGARQTVNELEKVPVLTQNLADTQKIADNRQTELNKANTLIGGLNTQVSGLNTQIAVADKACETKIDAVKSDARKGKVKAFKSGLVVGFVSGLLTRLVHIP